MIAARFRLVGWVAGCAGAALVCYMASQSVAAERGALARVDTEIADTDADIARISTEITARSRAGQVERWNGVLALQAARPAQYVSSEVQLASLAGGQRLPLDPAIVASHGAISTVGYQPTPAMPAPVARPMPVSAPPLHEAAAIAPPRDQPLLRVATFVRPRINRLEEDGPVAIKASFEKPAPARLAPAKLAPPKPKLKLAGAGPKDAGGLLPDDLGALIAAERKAKHAKSSL